MRTPELVLLGGPNSGKTHFAGQLYGRLRRKKGRLLLRREGGTPADLSALEDVLRSLASGHAARHTSAQTWSEIVLPIVDAQGQAIELRWPDYGGEQLSTAFQQRAISQAWRERLRKASGWIVLIRLNVETTYSDALNRLREGSVNQAATSERASKWDANARWVELFQLLLHVAGHGSVQQVDTPRLIVMLSCFDELGTQAARPCEILASRLPLVYSFLESVWSAGAFSVWGLSALGRHLDEQSEDEVFIDEGPENQGWIVAPDGSRSEDLTLPLDWLLNPV